ncbi:UbiX family flavin prenyltransferase [Pseudoflavonifractor sp. 524-17]|uniref:UbiX family flavin prenyltransferase n=1 Tax=Pseudoflavonifractor sp. 524-17 TaxID=2304577 RepID=UPI001379AA8C|nr:flavin prenyltransferase UbiX [Pseudoflavonifractor sp. 524-17]NCE65293.1 UbiX family flavin prenyltransferase [Pseudoflavonifractor sp. 524-17]
MKQFIVGVTGASGTLYADRVLRRLLDLGHRVHLCVTDAGALVARSELEGWPEGDAAAVEAALRVRYRSQELYWHNVHAIWASIASGSFRTDGMVVVPCSMGTMSAIAHGASHNLLERAADVVLKERRRLILAVRETPLNTIHLQNMLTLSQCGAVIMPACPSFYQKPASLEELADFFAVRVLDQLGLYDSEAPRWEGELETY